jgi:hypothetical protein
MTKRRKEGDVTVNNEVTNRSGKIMQPLTYPRKRSRAGQKTYKQGLIYGASTSRGGVAYTRTMEEIGRHVGENIPQSVHM